MTDVNTPLIFNFCSRFLESFVDLVRIYRNFPEVQILVLNLFTDMTKNLEFTTLSPEQVSYFHTCVLKLLQTFSEANLGTKRATAWEEAEDEPYNDVSVVLDLLLHLLEVRGVDSMLVQTPNAVLPSTVVFSGINILIPMIKENMLKVSEAKATSRLGFPTRCLSLSQLALRF